jgi:hypothetical protein
MATNWADTLRSNIALMDDVANYIDAGGFIWCGTTGGTTNNQTWSPSLPIAAYVTGQKFIGIIGAGLTNTTAAVMNISGLGNKTIKHTDTTSLVGQELQAGNLLALVYDGTNLRMAWPHDSGLVTYTPTPTGFSANPTLVCRFRLIGRRCFLNITTSANGTSNTTGFTIPLPVAAATVASMNWKGWGTGTDNGAYQTNVHAFIASAGTSVTLEPQAGAVLWTAAGTKGATFHINYDF